MKPQLFYFIAMELLCGALAVAQVPPQNAPVAPVSESGSSQAMGAHLTPEQLDQLLGPIALYPDALIALILPAATEPSDVVLAARYLNGGDPAGVDEQPWDDSVRALAHYPDLVKWMDENLAWTRQLGAAFLDQPAEIMKSVQRRRGEARRAGTLVDTPQQQVVAEGETIIIVPAQPDVIYVPYYDPDIVYVRRHDYYPGPYLSFSVGFPVGFWLGYNVDWGRRRIWVVDHRERERYWHDQHDWRRPVFVGSTVVEHNSLQHAWSPNPAVVHPTRPAFNQAHPQIVHPAPISRGASRPGQPQENAASTTIRRGNALETHDAPRQPSEIRHAMPARPENLPPVPAPGQVVSPAQVQTPPTPAPVISRGGRGPQPEDNSPREHREHTAPVVTPNGVQTPGRGAVPVPQQPNIPNPPPIPFAPIRTDRAPQVAPTPAPAPQPKPQPPTQEDDRRRRRDVETERDK